MIKNNAGEILINQGKNMYVLHPALGLKAVNELWDAPPYEVSSLPEIENYYKSEEDRLEEIEDNWLKILLHKLAERDAKATIFMGAESKAEQLLLDDADIIIGEQFALTKKKIEAAIRINPRDMVIKVGDEACVIYDNWENFFVTSPSIIPGELHKPINLIRS